MSARMTLTAMPPPYGLDHNHAQMVTCETQGTDRHGTTLTAVAADIRVPTSLAGCPCSLPTLP